MIPRESITGLVLAGGRGSRMGGVDKGMQPFCGQPLVQQVIGRLAPQVGPMMISANRNRPQYEAFGLPVWPDADAGHEGPLAGLLAGLMRCTTPWLACVPCDSPLLPTDLVQRLATALMGGPMQAGGSPPPAADLFQRSAPPDPLHGPRPADPMCQPGPADPMRSPATADLSLPLLLQAGQWRPQPVFLLLRCSLRDDLAAALAAGERKAGRWLARHRVAHWHCEDAIALANANTLAELQALQDQALAARHRLGEPLAGAAAGTAARDSNDAAAAASTLTPAIRPGAPPAAGKAA